MNEAKIKEELLEVKSPGEKIGYGNLMHLASFLWRKDLKDNKYPIEGAFIPMVGKLTKEDERYDEFMNRLISSHKSIEENLLSLI